MRKLKKPYVTVDFSDEILTSLYGEATDFHKQRIVKLFDTFKEDYKLFNFGRKGKFTLKDIWDKVVITNIVYFEK